MKKKINPDYIFITFLDKNINSNSKILDLCNINNFKNIKYDKNLTKFKSFTLNDNYYELDSCILSNYNSDIINKGHAIAGIKCKGKNYVYNGWIKQTIDPSMIKTNMNTTPCELMEHNWENNYNDFCLNANTCKLDIPNKKDLCFSFNKGYRTYIYVKSKKIYKSIDKNISISSIESKDSRDIKDIKDSRKNKDSKDSKDIKDSKDSRENKDSKENKLCKEWINNKNINPETKRKIKDTSPIYKKYVKLCSEPLIKDLCKEWIKNKNINPETKRKIKDTSPIYKKYMKKCLKK
jgi:hypothetical protein